MIQQKTNCEFIQHQNGIYEIIFHEATRETVDQYIVYNNRIFQSSAQDAAKLILVDFSPSGVPPIAYFSRKMRMAMQNIQNRTHTRVAIVYSDSSLLGLISSTTRLLANHMDTIRFFKSDERTSAMNWLEKEN